MHIQNTSVVKTSSINQEPIVEPKKSLAHRHALDTFEATETSEMLFTIAALKTLGGTMAQLEKRAHAIGENANEVWVKIWNLKRELFTACRMCEANTPIQKQQLEAMRREMHTIDAGLKNLSNDFFG